MEKSCETCAHREECRKPIGYMFGFCNIDYKEEKKKNED